MKMISCYIYKFIVVTGILTFLLNFDSNAQSASVWINKYSQVLSLKNLISTEEDLFVWHHDRPNVNQQGHYTYTIYYWVNGQLRPNFPVTYTSPFSYNFNNYSISYRISNNGIVDVYDGAYTRVKITTTGMAKLIRFHLSAKKIDNSGNFVGNIFHLKDVVVQPMSSWEGNPFPNLNYKDGYLSWVILDYNPLF